MTLPFRTLVVDNHSLIRTGLALLLNSVPDFRVVGEADCGEDVLDLVHTLRPDLLVMDLSMPGAGGLEITRQVTEHAPYVRILILTRFSDRFHLRQALDAGAAAYVLKSSPPTRILEALREITQGRSFVDYAVGGKRPPDLAGPSAPLRHGVHTLTPRELDVLRATAAGASSKEIAARLELSTRTVEFHKYNGMRRLRLRGRAALLALALDEGWLSQTTSPPSE